MPNNSPENFAKSNKAVIVAPAGCGKTQLIADSVAHCEGRQLILTHTHAGVNSLRKRLKKKGVSSKHYRLETIHSFAVRYASAYPITSGIITSQPETNEEYENVITSATILLECELVKKILKASYTGVFVDEYQDCTVSQHKLILKLAENLPCRIVGDPLQGIFDFDGAELVHWERDVYPNIDSLDELSEPWRWKGETCNEALGGWLIDTARPALQNSQLLELHGLESIGVYWHPKPSAYTSGLREHAKSFDSIFAISAPANTNKPHSIVKNLKNWYRTIEPLTAKDLFKFAEKITATDGIKLLDEVLAFAYKCLTKIKPDCESVKVKLSGEFRNENKQRLQILFNRIIEGDSKSILDLFEFLESYKPTYKRWQLWHEMKKGLKLSMSEKLPLVEACWQVKNKAKYYENRIPRRCVSRTVLLKGLECDCAAVIDADELKPKDFYVAITRPSKELHIYSETPFYPSVPQDQTPDCPKCGSKLHFKRGSHGVFKGCSTYPKCKHTENI